MKKQKIIDLLQRSLLVKPETRNLVLKNIETLSEDQMDGIISILEESDNKQVDLVASALKENPNLLSEIRTQVHLDAKRNLKKAETASIAADKNVLDELDQQLESFSH